MGSSDVRDGVGLETVDNVLRIRLDRPERKNALHPPAMERIIEALEAASTHDSLRVIVIESAGDDFCTGADWVARNEGDDQGARPRTGSIQRRTPLQAHRLISLLVEVQLPVVCIVRGWAVGLGCQLALASDITLAEEDSRFWEPFVERGFTPDSGATWLLPRLVGVARAREMLLLGRRLSGTEAAEWGLIQRAVPADELETAAGEVIEKLVNGPTVAIGLTKRLLHRSSDRGLGEALEAEANALELSSRSPDFREGLSAFRDRRPPEFEGR